MLRPRCEKRQGVPSDRIRAAHRKDEARSVSPHGMVGLVDRFYFSGCVHRAHGRYVEMRKLLFAVLAGFVGGILGAMYVVSASHFKRHMWVSEVNSAVSPGAPMKFITV